MFNLKSISAAVALLAATGMVQAAPATVVSGPSALALATALGGSGITISNATYTGNAAQAGTFTGGTAAGLSINNGLVLSSGAAAAAGQTWSTNGGVPTTNYSGAGSALLSGTTFDASTLAFNLTTNSTTVSFNYFFASAEYSNYVNTQFNDQFDFFISGPGITGMKNIALVPGTNLPVTINNVNNGGPKAPGTNPSNSQYYIDNQNNANPNFDYDGLTTLFNASATGLTAGATYTLTLVIADTADGNLDSAVFLQAGSLTSAPPPNTNVPEPESLALIGAGLVSLALLRRRKSVAR